MMTQTVSAGRHDGSQQQYRTQPGSPTLTNPDMILPDYDDSISYDEPHQSMWNTQHVMDNTFQFDYQGGFNSTPDPLSTPIIYGNGTMLSDIGEVTEVESNVGGPVSRNVSLRSEHTGDGTGLRSPPTMVKKTLKKKVHQVKRERRLSIESTSTINTQDRSGAFLDVDDSASMGGDSIFQGDDEESMASSYVEEVPASYDRSAPNKSSAQRLSDDGYSSNSLSQRAEQILANAKMRLTTMEGNLSRARTLSYSSMSGGSTPSPTLNRPAPALRETSSTSPMPPSHSRNMSENVLPGAVKVAGYPQRSASALGVAGGYRQPLSISNRSADTSNGGSGKSTPLASPNSIDEASSEDSGASPSDSNNNNNNKRDSKRLSSLSNVSFGPYADGGLTRSASVAQMRDIQDQVMGLKGKISSLREQARADSMKRRSLQSLRTPSPFTHSRWEQGSAEQRAFYTPEPEPPVQAEANDGEDVANPMHETPLAMEGDAPASQDQNDGQVFDQSSDKQHGGHVYAPGVAYDSRETSDFQQPQVDALKDDTDDLRTENGDFYESDDKEAEMIDDASESGDSLYHDTHQHPISHEDREDAFDYEHFFLHSAMGTISRQGMNRRDSTGSSGSDESVETTRGPVVTRERRPSVDTTVSVDTFQTAAEGEASRSSTSQSRQVEEEEDRVYTPAEEFDEPHATSQSPKSAGSVSSGDGDRRYSQENSRPRQNSVVHRPVSAGSVSTLHRPSCSSFESTGTNRSFPLVNKAKLSDGILTPGASPDHGLKQISETLMNDTASICDRESILNGNGEGDEPSPAIRMLSRDDQQSIEGLVASLGKCVLALGEASRDSIGSSHNVYRQRIEAARRILEGVEDLSTAAIARD